MYQSTKRAIFILMAGILLLAACAPAAPAPTQDPAEVEQQIQEAVVLTVAAQNAQQTQAAAALPTNTPLPTQTEAGEATPTPLIPTATPFVVVPPTTAPSTGGGGGGGGGTTTKPEYSCDVIGQRPYDDTYFKPGDSFDVKWTIVNTGTKTWPAGKDLKYSNGPKMTASSVFELPEMKPGDQYSVNFDAVAPNEEGYQVMVWVLEGPVCYPYVRIIVER